MRERRVETLALQGEGTYVVVTPLTWENKRQYRRDARHAMRESERLMDDALKAEAAGQFDEGDRLRDEATAVFMQPSWDLLREHVLEWNWTDAQGQALPLPNDDPEVVKRLTEDEILLLAQAITGEMDATEAKN